MVGPALASLGYSVFILETNAPTDALAARADALIAAVDFIKSENQNPDAPVANKIDPEKLRLWVIPWEAVPSSGRYEMETTSRQSSHWYCIAVNRTVLQR